MAGNYSQLKGDIIDYVKQNGDNLITGNGLQGQLLAMVNSLGAGYQYMGVAVLTPTPTDPGTPDQNVFYIAYQPGTYANFGLSVADGEVAIFKYNGTWSKEVTGAATAAQVTELGQEIEDNLSTLAQTLAGYDGKTVPVTGTATTDTEYAMQQGKNYLIYTQCLTATTTLRTGLFVKNANDEFTQIAQLTEEQFAEGYFMQYTPSEDVTLWVRPYSTGDVVVKLSDLSASIKDTNIKITELDERINVIQVNHTFRPGYYFAHATRRIVANADFSMIQIPVKAGDRYLLTGRNGRSTNADLYDVVASDMSVIYVRSTDIKVSNFILEIQNDGVLFVNVASVYAHSIAVLSLSYDGVISAIASESFQFSNIVKDGLGNIVSADIVWPDLLPGTMTATYTNGQLTQIDYTRGDTTYRQTFVYTGNDFVSNTITKL